MSSSTDIVQVLSREVDNTNILHMYLEGDSWCAYERSAFYLIHLHLHLPLTVEKEVLKEGYDLVLLKAKFKVTDMMLPLAPTVCLKEIADDSVTFLLRNPEAGFPEWKKEQLQMLAV